MTQPKILHVDQNHPLLLKGLEALGYENVLAYSTPLNELLPQLDNYIGLVIRSRFPVDKKCLDYGTHLKFIARVGAGLENINVEYAKEKGIELIAAPEGNRNAVAEHCLGFLLSLLNNFKQAQCDIQNGEWLREKSRGIEISNLCVGIIGYGNNGRAFAEKLSSIGVKVLVYDKYVNGFSREGVYESNMEEIFKESNVISFHVPLTKETTHIADYQFFKRFNKPVWVLNISRGKVLKTKDLIRGLNEGIVCGAALDVLDEESKSFDMSSSNRIVIDLNNRSNVIITPHVAGWTQESYFKLSNVLADKILE